MSQSMTNTLLVFSALTLFLMSIVPVKAETQKIAFEGPVRLQQALSDLQEQGLLENVYWPAVRLVKTDEQDDVSQQKREVLAQLAELERYWQSRREASKAEAAAMLSGQIRGWQLGKQPWGEISIEQARQRLADNPLLPEGNYELVVSERPNSIYVFGLVSKPGSYQFHTGKTVANWLDSIDEQVSLLESYNKETAVKVSVAEQKESNWSYYKQDNTELLPGDILWLGFEKNQLPPKFKNLDKNVRDLLTHFVTNESVRAETNAPLHKVRFAPTPERHWSRLDLQPSYNNYGSVGLMQNPTARMAKEGQLAITYSDIEEYRRYTVNLQLLPWLEATAFYTRFPNRLYSEFPGFSGDNILTDKGFDVKARLWKESYWLPEVSLGFRDLAGTGLFDAEYIVGSKRFGPVDISLGLGFGRLGTYDNITNPFCELADDYCRREPRFSGRGGKLEYDQWFTGTTSFFGGIEYQTPWEPLSLKAEYEGNDYSDDQAGVPIKPDSRWNFGANYQVTEYFDVQLSYERGDTLMFNFSLRTNFNELNQVKTMPDKTPPQKPKADKLSDVSWTALRSELRKQGAFSGARFAATDDEVTMYAYHHRFRNSNEAYDRAARVLSAELPDSVKTYNIVDQVLFEPNVNTQVQAQDFKRRIRNEDPSKTVEETEELFTRVYPEGKPDKDSEKWKLNPDYHFSNSYGLKPFFQQDFGSPENFHTYQLGVYAFGKRWLTENLEVFAEAGINLANNYDEFNFLGGGPSQLPEVRTQVRRYVQNDVWLDSAQVTYHKRLGQDWFAMAYAGYLERMFGGAGAEVLYRPIDSPWAFGAHVNRVRQRNFTGGSGFLDYEVTTGFVSAYYQMPWLSDTLLQLDFGQFLAGDQGVNVTLQKRFDSGVVAGAFAAFTDVSSEEYGEGSFTKGFFISIPFDLMSVRNTRERVGFSWIPLSRNGGQQLHRRARLYDYTDDRSPFYNR